MAVAGQKFFNRNLIACLQEVASSFCLFNVAYLGLQQIMKYFSHEHKLHRFETGLYIYIEGQPPYIYIPYIYNIYKLRLNVHR